MTTTGREAASIWMLRGGSVGEIQGAGTPGATTHGIGAVRCGATGDPGPRTRRRRKAMAWIRAARRESTVALFRHVAGERALDGDAKYILAIDAFGLKHSGPLDVLLRIAVGGGSFDVTVTFKSIFI